MYQWTDGTRTAILSSRSERSHQPAAGRTRRGARPTDPSIVAGLRRLLPRSWRDRLPAPRGRRGEAESFARILSGLSRSISPDAILSAIVDELARATDADHIVVVRRRPDARVLDATLISARAGVPDSSTLLPIADLEDPVFETHLVERDPVSVAVMAEAPRAVTVGAAGADIGSSAELGR